VPAVDVVAGTPPLVVWPPVAPVVVCPVVPPAGALALPDTPLDPLGASAPPAGTLVDELAGAPP
jgi:hypothetical protein